MDIDTEMMKWLEERLIGHIDDKPKQILSDMKEEFKDMDHGCTDDQLKKKISSAKAIMKAKAWKKIT